MGGSTIARRRRLPGGLSRRGRILAVAGALLLAGGVAAALVILIGPGDPLQHFRSRPDLLAPQIEVLERSPQTAPGDLFIAAKDVDGHGGPMILDPQGRLLWFHHLPRGTGAFDFRVQRYRGRPVLTWFQGKVVNGHGVGHDVIADTHYRVIHRIDAVGGPGYASDLHEFQLTPRGTALITVYHTVRRDLSSVGGATDGKVVDGIVQEIDVRTGRLVWQWHSLDHLALSESLRKPSSDPDDTWDPFHVNSAVMDGRGDVLISARHSSAIYEIDHRTGRVIWRLGGNRSDFRMAPDARFAYQHDARRAPDGTITLFDNESPPQVRDQSRGLALRLHPRTHTATVAHEYDHDLLSSSQGNVQSLPNGDVMVGWGGDVPYFSEYTHDGRMLFDARFAADDGNSYRAYRLPWHARPGGRPAIAADAGRDGVTVYASWNGATEVRRWQVLGGPRPGALAPLASGPWTNFESTIHAPAARYVAVRALDAAGHVLGTSETIAARS